MRIISRRGDGWRVGLVLGLLAVAPPFGAGADEPGAGLRPLVRSYCLECHGGDQPEAGLDLGAMADAPEFGRRFKAAFSATPAAYLERLRLDEARLRLAAGRDAVARIAHAVGFGSDDAFRRAFERRFGVTPGAYRTGLHP